MLLIIVHYPLLHLCFILFVFQLIVARKCSRYESSIPTKFQWETLSSFECVINELGLSEEEPYCFQDITFAFQCEIYFKMPRFITLH